MYRCSAAACGVPLEMIWTRYWSTVFYLSSTLEIGSCSHMLAPTVWVNHCAPPLTHHHPLCTTSSPLETGKFGSDGRKSFLCKNVEVMVLDSCLFSFTRFEMQDTGVTNEAMLKNFSLVPYFLNSCQTEAALSVPA